MYYVVYTILDTLLDALLETSLTTILNITIYCTLFHNLHELQVLLYPEEVGNAGVRTLSTRGMLYRPKSGAATTAASCFPSEGSSARAVLGVAEGVAADNDDSGLKSSSCDILFKVNVSSKALVALLFSEIFVLE